MCFTLANNMKTLVASAIISLVAIFSAMADTLEYCIFNVQGDQPASAEIIRLYKADLLSPFIKGSAQIESLGGFTDEKMQRFQYVTKSDSYGNVSEKKEQKLGHYITGTAEKISGSYGVELSLEVIQKLSDKFYLHQNGKATPQPILQSYAIKTHVTLYPDSEWIVIGGGSSPPQASVMIALRIKKKS